MTVETTPNEPTEVEATEPEPGSKEYNFARLREENERLKAENAELRPLKFEKAIREAGFDPAADKGKSLLLAIEAGKVEASPEAVKEYATSFFGWNPEPQLNPTEQTQVQGGQRLEGVIGATDSHVPPATDIQAQIAEAEAAGDLVRAMTLKTQWIAQMQAGSGT